MQETGKQHGQRVSQGKDSALSTTGEHERQTPLQFRRRAARSARARAAGGGSPVGYCAHAVETFVGDELSRLPAAVEEFGLVAALWVREALHALGVSDQDRFRLADLQPPRKTRRLNRQGRVLTITPELLITSTTGIRRPLGDSAKTAAFVAAGHVGKLRRRIESDVKALFAYYQYGVFHGRVRLRWGFVNEALPVDWTVPGDVDLHDMLKKCCTAGTRVDLVCGSAPGWDDPWLQARRVKIVSLNAYYLDVESEGRCWSVTRDDIQAIRPAEESPAGG